jgi:FolB domain-containing protein
MDQIIIRDLLARGIIGVNDWEREKPQDILINIILFADLRQSGETDDLNTQRQLPHHRQESPAACRDLRPL